MSSERDPAEASTPLARVSVADLVAALPDGVAIVGPDGLIHHVSERAARILGYASGAALVGRPGVEIIAPTGHDHLRERLERYASRPSATPTPTAYPVRRADGSEAWIEVTSTPLRDAAGALTSWLAVIRDITERVHSAETQRARERAEAAEHQQRAVLEGLPIAVAVASGSKQRMSYVNPRFEALFGYTLADIPYAADFRRRAHPDPAYRAEVEAEWADRKAAATGRGAIEPIVMRVVARDGGERFVRAQAALLGDQQVVAFVDLTDQRRHEEELMRARDEAESASRAKSDFLATMSHELRTPLNAILGFSETLGDGLLGELNDAQHHGVERIQESGRHLLALISDLLDLSKIEAGRMDVDITPVDVEGVCQASLRLVRDAAEKKQLRLAFAMSGAPTMRSDERRLKQILVNLLGNAVKFTQAGGDVGLDVTFDDARREVRFVVWDSGIGIAPADLERLFRPFVQVDSSLTRRFEGTGLGLALVARLSALLGGAAAVESELGRGSRFSVTLPLGV